MLCKIADFIIDLDCSSELERELFRKYSYNGEGKIQAKFSLDREYVKDSYHITDESELDSLMFNLLASDFFLWMLDHHALTLHASCVVMEGKAYLFSACSGTGKSTHTQLWLKHYGSRALILNDDKPILRVIDQQVIAYGSPWMGKEFIGENKSAPAGGICLLRRDSINHIRRIRPAEGIAFLVGQTLFPTEQSQIEQEYAVFEEILALTPLFEMGCTISEDAAAMAWEAMRDKDNNR